MFDLVEIALAKVEETEPQMSQGMEKREDLPTQLFPPESTNSFELDALVFKPLYLTINFTATAIGSTAYNLPVMAFRKRI